MMYIFQAFKTAHTVNEVNEGNHLIKDKKT